jgi:prefoldin subunit 5
MKNSISFRTILFLLPALILIASPVFSQSTSEEARKLQRPKDSGVKDYDEFKNSSFNLLQELLKADDNYAKIKADINGYAEGSREATVNNIRMDYGRLKKLKKSTEVMDDRVKSLSSEGEELLQNASKVKPVTKVKAATSNTKKSIKAVDYSKSMMSEITAEVTTDMETLSEKLAEMGEVVEEE